MVALAHVLAARGDYGMHEVLTPSEAAAFLRLSQSFLAKARVTGTGPAFIKAGGRILYMKEALLKWLADRERFSTSEYRGA
ncbi:MAG: helix-turn-helix domain-containing protein [Defluviicoccus sp.]